MPLIGDEENITMLVNAQNAKNSLITNEVTVGGIKYQCEKLEFPPDFSVVLPKDFIELAPEYVVIKYPNVNRLKTILSNQDTTVNFAFELMSIKTEELETRLTKYKSVTKKIYPSDIYFSQQTYNLESGLTLGTYDYQGIALDDDIYYLNFITDLPNGELFGSFTCPINVRSQWEPVIRQLLLTIKPWPQKEAEENA